ncbi:MAG: hypothetical protein LWX55_04095 [Deltaproteobacteria bacterium]|jgi:hypothetical protein|nr:hypothetical protein [Deltaproteobacteria bacterium]
MTDGQGIKPDEKSVAAKADTTADTSTSMVLAGAEKQTDGKTHVGVAVKVASDGKPSILMIPDVAGKTGGPVFTTKPILINGANLKTFLQKKGVDLPKEISNLIEDTKISCDAFYYTQNEPLLMMFGLKLDKGLIESLTGDKDIGNLFDVKSVALKVLRCEKDSFDILKQYAAGLEG